jgi:hypothetical protein
VANRQLPLPFPDDDDDDDEYPEELYGGRPPSESTETSTDAARSMSKAAQKLRAKVLRLVSQAGPHGCTDEEIQLALRMAGNTERPRRRELVLLGEAFESGRYRLTRSRRQAIVWVSKAKWVLPLDAGW